MEDISVLSLPLEMILQIMGQVDASTLCALCLVCKDWYELSRTEKLWRNLYKKKWLTNQIIDSYTPVNSWKTIFSRRRRIEAQYLIPENNAATALVPVNHSENNTENNANANTPDNDVEHNETTIIEAAVNPPAVKPPEPPKPKTMEDYFARAELLKKKSEVDGVPDPVMWELLQVASEEYASCMILLPGTRPANENSTDSSQSNSYYSNQAAQRVAEYHLKYGCILSHLVKLNENGVNMISLSLRAGEMFSLAANVTGFFLQENAFRYWGDILIDISKKKEGAEAEEYLKLACEKYEFATDINPSYSFAFYYWGRALHIYAKLKKNDATESDRLFKLSCAKFQVANNLRADDAYVLYEWALTLHDYAMTKEEDAEADALFEQAQQRYSEAHHVMPTDIIILRNWADTLYDNAKSKYLRLKKAGKFTESIYTENAALITSISKMLTRSFELYESAVTINPTYINALNSWGLALATLAKITNDPAHSAKLFEQSYSKFLQAIEIKPTQTTTEVCNYAMTLISHAMKCDQSQWENSAVLFRDLLKQAKNKLRPLLVADADDRWAVFCLSRLYSVSKKEEKCYRELVKVKHFLNSATESQLSYFENVANRDWFKQLQRQAATEKKPQQK